MLTLLLLYRRAPWPLRMIALAVLLIVFVSTIARVFKATHQIQERNTRVLTHRNAR